MITFHAKPSREAKHPSHTLCFDKKDGNLLCTFARPHPGLEAYCKTTGNQVSQQRMHQLYEELENQEGSVVVASRKELSRVAPSCVRKTLSYYVDQARRYYKTEDENPLVVFRGVFADWGEHMKNSKKGRVKKLATISLFRASDLV